MTVAADMFRQYKGTNLLWLGLRQVSQTLRPRLARRNQLCNALQAKTSSGGMLSSVAYLSVGLLYLGWASGQAPAPAPGPSGAYGCYTALNVLQASGRYNAFLGLLDSTDLGGYFDDPTRFITVFAPTDTGIQRELRSLGTNVNSLANSTSAVQDILEYHILPSPVLGDNALQVTALQNGNSFNTLFTQNREVQTVSINRTMDMITVNGAFSLANVTSTGTMACGSVVYSLDGLLIPSISLSFIGSS